MRPGSKVEIAFATKKLRDLCESERMAQRNLGARVAEKLKRRLADLRAATCAKDLIVGQPRELTRNQIEIKPCDGYRVVLHANHNTIPSSNDGAVDWSQVTRVKVMFVEKAQS